MAARHLRRPGIDGLADITGIVLQRNREFGVPTKAFSALGFALR